MKKFFLLAASAMMVFASCNKIENVYNGEAQEIGIFAVNKVATKGAVTDATFPDVNMAVAAYLAAGYQATPADYFAKTVFSKTGAVWTGSRYWPLSQATINFLAVAPEIDDVVTTVFGVGTPAASYASKAVVTLENNETNQHDVMYAAAQGTCAGDGTYSNVGMVFKHALSWLTFTVNAGSDSKITINSVDVNNAYFGGTLTIEHTNYASTDADEAKTIALNKTNWEVADANKIAKRNVLAANFADGVMVVPGSQTTLTLNYTIKQADGTQNNFSREFTLQNTWEEATKYIYDIKVTLSEIQIAPTVETWGSTDPENTPVLVPEPAPAS